MLALRRSRAAFLSALPQRLRAARTVLPMGQGLTKGLVGSIAAAAFSSASSAAASSPPSPPSPPFVGPYASTRALLDYEYHTRPSVERQQMQDIIISKALQDTVGKRLPQPWLVYTGGPFGAGKSRTLRHLNSLGAFPLDSFVLVDADRLKDQLPELQALLRESPEYAHTRLHRESGYLAEIIEREAMLQSRSVIVDGSLRDANHYARAIGKIRAEFPHYRIALLWVRASRETVYQRAEKRAKITGRHVPKEALDSALRQVPSSFAVLSSLVDYAGIVDNDKDGEDPVFAAPFTMEGFAALWKQEPKEAALLASMPLKQQQTAATTTTTTAEGVTIDAMTAEAQHSELHGLSAADSKRPWALFPGASSEDAEAAKAAAKTIREAAAKAAKN